MEERINFFPKKVVIEVSARTCRNFIMDTCLDDFMDYMFAYNSFTMSAYLDEKMDLFQEYLDYFGCARQGYRDTFLPNPPGRNGG